MEFTLKEGVVLRLSLTSTRYHNGLIKDHEYMKHSLKNCGEKNMDNTVWQLLCYYFVYLCVKPLDNIPRAKSY